jgi:hypothetical protein
MQIYLLILNPNNRKDPIIAGNKKLTAHIMVLRQINIKLFVYQGASSKTINCPRMIKSVSAMAGIMLKQSSNTATAIHKSIIGMAYVKSFFPRALQ